MTTYVTKAEMNAAVAASAEKLNARITELVKRCNALEEAEQTLAGEVAELKAEVPKEEPATEPEPTPAPKADIFAGAAVKDFSYIEQGHVGAISEVIDPQAGAALKFDVLDSDVYPKTATENPRAKLSAPATLKIGGPEFWLRSRFMIPADFPSLTPGGWLTLVDVYGPPASGSAAVKVGLGNDAGTGDWIGWEQDEAHKWARAWSQPLKRGHWYDLLWHEKLATTGGLIEMWLDGEQVVSKTGYATAGPSHSGGPNSPAISQYRKHGMFTEGSVYYSGLWVGSTRASVGG